MNALWSYFWPLFALALVVGAIAGMIAWRSAARRWTLLAAGAVAMLGVAMLWHGPLGGGDRLGKDPAHLDEPGGSISFQFHARDLHLVMGPPLGVRPVRFRVRLDGGAPGPAHGIDVDQHGAGTADYQRVYQLIRQPAPIGDRRFDIEFLDAGVEAFVFTFG